MSHFKKSKPDNTTYPRLSLPIELLKSEYDVVVVGSGYGAGTAASRMARAGKKVAVLELGQEYRPGSFSHSLWRCLQQLSVSGSSKHSGLLQRWLFSSDPTRLFQLVLGEGQHVFAAHGLGGGSLINAGVFLEADTDTLQMSAWPTEIRSDPSRLKQYYSRAATMLQPTVYPDEDPKLRYLEEEAKILGNEYEFYKVPLTTFFHKGQNYAGVEMQPNDRSGHECTGLNDGSKNTVAATYLADAWHWGAEIFCGCEVRYVEEAADGRGYIIYFSWHTPGRAVFNKDFRSQLFWVRATEWCFLGAGALGTTEILLRSKNYGLPLSPMVGRNMSGNGDLLVFGYNGDSDVNGIASNPSRRQSKTGPTITGAIDNRHKRVTGDFLSGHIIQDGCIPEPFAPIIHLMLLVQTWKERAAAWLLHPRNQLPKTLATVKSLLLGPYAVGGAIQRTSTYLVMSHDSGELTLTLEEGRLCFRGPKSGCIRTFEKIKPIMKKILGRTGANVGYSYFFGRHQEDVTVHILGGARMSRSGTGCGGATNHLGQVYTGYGSEVYRGLVCCDGSVIPTSLSVNPLATITALAERSLALLATQYKLSVDLTTENPPITSDSKPRRPLDSPIPNCQNDNGHSSSIGWQFTEVLEGYMGTKPNTIDFVTSETIGRSSSSAMRMCLTIEICHEKQGSQIPQYYGRCNGTVSCRSLSTTTMRVVGGQVAFFSPAKGCAEATSMAYTMSLISLEGKQYILKGQKTIGARASLSVRNMWNATSTVDITVETLNGSRIGAGVLRIPWSSFPRQLTTFRPTKGLEFAEIVALIIFLVLFVMHISLVFFRPVIAPKSSHPVAGEAKNRRKQSPVAARLIASDGVDCLVEIYDPLPVQEQPIPKKDSLSAPILFIPGLTGVGAPSNIFALPFQDCNMVDYFVNQGCRCYVLRPRWSCHTLAAKECNVFDARLDIAAAIKHVIHHEGCKPYVIGHCQGSVALGMGILDGTINRKDLLGITANSVFLHQVFAYWNSKKGASSLLIRIHEYLGGDYFPIAPNERPPLFQKILDLFLRLYPVSRRRDICSSSVCHRASFAFGLLWNHDNLDADIHNNIHHFFDGTYTKILEHVIRMGSRGQCLNTKLESLLTPKNINNLAGLPILWISGAQNEVFDPESTLLDYEMLRRRFGESMYQRFLVDKYGHLDTIVGKRAAEDVYWRVLDHFQWCNQISLPT